eukprot:CAMPEP_0196163910 /NCGR_PEP_ID=MMETSP0911-20130528/230_1 /TAXON_ID=49265 /ORGANISM="Thalassiosira rotula, Strain GSO102" /LENGTH=58 /DNA_ID=CAMNT_0041428955 /DNA_START=400 /DNA_END=572 /DNA_ORIENTATION=-
MPTHFPWASELIADIDIASVASRTPSKSSQDSYLFLELVRVEGVCAVLLSLNESLLAV